MLIALRSAIFNLGQVLFTAFYGLILLPILLLPRLARHKVLVSWCWLIVQWARICCGIRYRVIGLEHVQNATAGRVYLSKHQSTWETFMLQNLCFPAATILKKELLRIPVFGWGLACLQPIAINRSNPREALKMVKEGGIARLHSGINLLLFPEGTRVAPGERGKYARSGADIAIAAGAEVVPVAVNAGHCWPPKSQLKYPGTVTVVFGAPIDSKGMSSRDLIQQVESWIEHTMSEIERDQGEQNG